MYGKHWETSACWSQESTAASIEIETAIKPMDTDILSLHLRELFQWSLWFFFLHHGRLDRNTMEKLCLLYKVAAWINPDLRWYNMDQRGAQLKSNSCHATTTKYTIPRTNNYFEYVPTSCFEQSYIYITSWNTWCTNNLSNFRFIRNNCFNNLCSFHRPLFIHFVPFSSILLNKVATGCLRVHAKYNHSAKRVRSFSSAGRKQGNHCRFHAKCHWFLYQMTDTS